MHNTLEQQYENANQVTHELRTLNALLLIPMLQQKHSSQIALIVQNNQG